MKKLIVAFALVISLFSTQVSQVSAGEHQPGLIIGNGISLFERDHAFSGQILKTPLFGAFDHEPFGAKMLIRKGESTLELNLSTRDEKYGGTIVENARKEVDREVSREVSTQIEFLKARKTGETEGVISLTIDGQLLEVTVKGKTFENNHFQSPTFTAAVGAKTVTFTFTGESCFGYSTNIAMMIFGAYVHLSK